MLLAVHTVPEQVSAILATLNRSGATDDRHRELERVATWRARSIRTAFTIGVFQDAAWARRGVEALLRDGFIRRLDDDPRPKTPRKRPLLIESTLGAPADRVELKALGPVVARGPLVAALQGADNGLESSGLGATIGRAGFQAHDGYIYETLTGRGGDSRGDSERAAGRGCAREAARVRRGQRRHRRLDREGLTKKAEA